jgi:DMSO/TMAO reductase YedYZ heme-binding membrane subunit
LDFAFSPDHVVDNALRRLAGIPDPIRFRRMVGLFGFFYGSLHLLIYLSLDKFFDLNEILQDIAKRKFITVGLAGLLLMIPLAVTSTAGWIRRLRGRRWQLLHRLVYASAIAGVVHNYWLVKSDIRLPVLYGSILTILLAYRLIILHPRWLRGGNRAKIIPAQRLEKEALLQTGSSEASLQPQAVALRGASAL